MSGTGSKDVAAARAMRVRFVKSAVLFFTAALWSCYLISVASRTQASTNEISGSHDTPPIPSGPFAPSNARTEDGKLIPVEQFFPASRCAKCHQDTHTGWSESLHRNAAREPFYRESADILLRTRGIEFTRHCESCHTPVALFSGTLTKNSGRPKLPSRRSITKA
ncbi:MAG: multiheme c-type cytochrome [Blastocatellia bacterium]